MQKLLRKLCLLLGLVFTVSALSGPSQPAAADQGCPWEHFQCPDPFYDCCCDKGVACTNNEYECARFCGQI